MYTLCELETEKCVRNVGVMYTLCELDTEKCVRNAGCHVHTMGAGD